MSIDRILLWVGCFVGLLAMWVLMAVVWLWLPPVVQVELAVIGLVAWTKTVYRRVDRR